MTVLTSRILEMPPKSLPPGWIEPADKTEIKKVYAKARPPRPSRIGLRRVWEDFASGRRLRKLRSEFVEKGKVFGMEYVEKGTVCERKSIVQYREGHEFPWEIMQYVDWPRCPSWRASWTLEVKELDEYLYSAYVEDIGKDGVHEALGLVRGH